MESVCLTVPGEIFLVPEVAPAQQKETGWELPAGARCLVTAHPARCQGSLRALLGTELMHSPDPWEQEQDRGATTSPAGPGSQLFSSKPPTEPGWGLDLLNTSSAPAAMLILNTWPCCHKLPSFGF